MVDGSVELSFVDRKDPESSVTSMLKTKTNIARHIEGHYIGIERMKLLIRISHALLLSATFSIQ